MIIWLSVGGLLGWGASQLTGQREGRLFNVVVGVLSAFIIGYVLTPLLHIGSLSQADFSLAALSVSLLGLAMFLAALSLFRRGGPRLR